MSIAVPLIAAATLALAVGVGGLWARTSLRQWAAYRRHRDRFFVLAKELIGSDDCPLELALAMRQIGATMNDAAVLGIVLFMASTRWKVRPRPGRLSEIMEKSPASVRKRFTAAFREACLAVSYRSVLLGGIIRKGLNNTNDRPNEADQAAASPLVRHGLRHNPPDYAKSLAGKLCPA